jgi:LuxR family transcriptional regulator, maltose regulon positive regulatory protein
MLAADRDSRIVLLCAPAGFGKTILAAQLIRSDHRPSCWITLEDSDNDPVRLLNDLVLMLADLGSIAPQLAHELASSAPRIDEVVLPLLARQLESCDPFVLVLDDVELATHPGSLAIISCLVDHVPARSQLVLAARGEPEILLARLRAAGDVLDLGAADLALDPCETRELLSTGGITMSQDQVREVQERAEGWAAGIALAMFPRAGHDEAGDLPAIGRSPDVAAYLLEEAVQRQPPDVRHFLLASSVLRRMSPALCDAALEIADSARLLAELERTSLFVIPLNGDGEWYRFHHLFRELLQAEQHRQGARRRRRSTGASRRVA